VGGRNLCIAVFSFWCSESLLINPTTSYKAEVTFGRYKFKLISGDVSVRTVFKSKLVCIENETRGRTDIHTRPSHYVLNLCTLGTTSTKICVYTFMCQRFSSIVM